MGRHSFDPEQALPAAMHPLQENSVFLHAPEACVALQSDAFAEEVCLLGKIHGFVPVHCLQPVHLSWLAGQLLPDEYATHVVPSRRRRTTSVASKRRRPVC